MASAVTGVAPELMGVGPIEAIRQVLDRAGMAIGDIDVVELNGAFAAQVLAVCQLNPRGGAIALGHPFGMTGVRLVGAVLDGLDRTDGTLGLAVLLERL